MEDEDARGAARRAQEEAAYEAEQKEKRRREEQIREERAAAERRAEKQRELEERQRVAEEAARKKKEEEMFKRLGPDVIPELPPVPNSFVDDTDAKSMKAWYLDEETSKPTFRVQSLKPGRKAGTDSRVTLLQLRDIGIVYFRINLSDFGLVNQIVKERRYKHTDEIRAHQTHKDESYLEKWFTEHYHEDEQIRLVTDGSCYFDVRSKHDTWIRLRMNPGDLIVIPAGMYHRATLDENDYVAVMRMFFESGRWNPIFRTEKKAETLTCRLNYLRAVKRGNAATENGWK
eukprot:PhF_6_TR22759/c3_g1_i1/m.32452/K08967/mtnD, mtnZ, ADI1; 1,2-dihydroxy-3-keto-5-methylthiopentene dioxygenase